jgi:hypothetical protein
MIIYTAMPLEMVCEGFESYKPLYKEIEYLGIRMQVEPIGPNQAKIVRLLSSNPQDYLYPSLSPGNTILFR